VRVLLDEQMPAELIAELSAHEVRTVAQMQWKGMANGALLTLAAEQFDVMISMDQNMPVQQDMSRDDIGLVLIRARSNRIETLRPLLPAIERALATVRRGTVERAGPAI
jgi:hypothetical protein